MDTEIFKIEPEDTNTNKSDARVLNETND